MSSFRYFPRKSQRHTLKLSHIDAKVIIDEGTKLFVSAVGVPPKEVIDKLHSANIPVMNMAGLKHGGHTYD